MHVAPLQYSQFCKTPNNRQYSQRFVFISKYSLKQDFEQDITIYQTSYVCSRKKKFERIIKARSKLIEPSVKVGKRQGSPLDCRLSVIYNYRLSVYIAEQAALRSRNSKYESLDCRSSVLTTILQRSRCIFFLLIDLTYLSYF
jgi:hypothetical protein